MKKYMIHAKLTRSGYYVVATLTRKALKGFVLIDTQLCEYTGEHALSLYAGTHWRAKQNRNMLSIKFPKEVKEKNRKAR